MQRNTVFMASALLFWRFALRPACAHFPLGVGGEVIDLCILWHAVPFFAENIGVAAVKRHALGLYIAQKQL